jgi:amino acid adenylation domain-containing protein
MLFNSLYAPQSGVDIEQMVISLREDLNVAAFQQAWQHIVDLHPVLRTGFRWHGLETPLQDVYRQVDVSFNYEDWRKLSPQQQQEQQAVYLQADRQHGFELTQAPLMRLALLQLGEADFRCIWTFHHILMDGRSFPTILRRLFSAYDALCQGRDVKLKHLPPYKDYIEWLQQQNPDNTAPFWRQLLAGFTAPTPLINQPVKTNAASTQLYGHQEICLSAATTAALQSLANQHQLTLNTFVQGAWALLLSRYSGEPDVVFGATRACRHSTVPDAETMVGLFINTLPVRARVSPDALLIPWLQELRAQNLALREEAREHTPLVKVQEWSEIPAGKPLFESILVFENYYLNTALQAQGGHWANRNFELVEQTNYPLTVNAYADTGLWLKIAYDTSRFEADTISRMLGHLKTLLEGMVIQPTQCLASLPLLTAVERRQLLVEWNDTQVDYPQDACLHQLFEAQVERTPDTIAVKFEDKALTYRELNQQANQLAHYLRGLGVGPDTLVGVYMERSLEMVVSLYGVLKAGGAYVPLDPEYPAERVAFMLEDAQAPVLLTQQKLVADLPKSGAKIICLDSDWANFIKQSTENLVNEASPENLAYVIFTSGSTGRPKGVMNSHRGICNRLLWMQDAYHLTPADRVMQKTPFSFDVSVWEFFWPLLVGARLVVAQPGGHRDSAYLVNLIVEQGVTTLHFVPSMLQVFLEDRNVEQCRSLKRVICSGEALSYPLQQRFFEHLKAELHNLYGPTEAAVDVTYWACRPKSNYSIVPIGRPVANTQIYILDSHMQPVPIGIPGELHIGGAQVARGYLNRPELTAQKFIDDPFSHESGARLYKTGDLARYLPDGDLEYLGRIDHQVKIRGFRIELGEIEAALGQHPAVREVVVITREDEPGNKRLAAYIAPEQNQQPTPTQLRNFLSQKLPDYMIPSAFVILDALPLTPNGKVDRRALPVPAQARPDLEYDRVSPRTPTEAALTRIWAEILGLEQVGVHDNFFELGGHSLLAAQVIFRARDAFGVKLPLRRLFETPTIAELAVAIEKTNDKDTNHLNEQKEADNLHNARRMLGIF